MEQINECVPGDWISRGKYIISDQLQHRNEYHPVLLSFIPPAHYVKRDLRRNLYQSTIVFASQPSFPVNQVHQMKLRNLPITDCCVDVHLTVRDVVRLFDQHPDWTGVILTSQSQFIGMLSRQRCFEVLGRPFGIEVFSKKTILEFLNSYGSPCLMLDAETSIQEAVKLALNRDHLFIYEPIVIHTGKNNYGLLTMHTLLLAQSDLLESLYEEVQQLSVRDPLTNLNNRRGFFEAAQQEIAVVQPDQDDLSALMIDIDHFKNTNDIYGHFVGDKVIRSVAAECQKTLRQTDMISRFGGEEFIALLPNTSLAAACNIAERIRYKIEHLVVFVDGFQISVTVSIGVCCIKEAHGSLDVLLNQADQAMYGAKAAGRNQVMTWDHQVAYRIRKQQALSSTKDRYVEKWPERMRINAARIYDETIEGWAKALEMRDKETEGHAKRVVNMTIALARRIGIDEKELVDIRRGALLHDIGKIAIPDPILFKPGPLTDEEWSIMHKHPVYAFELLSPITFLNRCIDIPYCHHEHWDGSGYPRGLTGEEIPIAARIFTVVDVWDALSTNRCYRLASHPEEVRAYIEEQSGKLLDPKIVPIFLELFDEMEASKRELPPRKGGSENGHDG